jgi:hypothetical protein
VSHYAALFDANVLYPAPLRDLLLQLAVTDIFKANGSADIRREWITRKACSRTSSRPSRTSEIVGSTVISGTIPICCVGRLSG